VKLQNIFCPESLCLVPAEVGAGEREREGRAVNQISSLVFDIKPQAQFQLVFIRDMRDTIMNLQQSVTNSFSKRE
jgi:hypothetical protein